MHIFSWYWFLNSVTFHYSRERSKAFRAKSERHITSVCTNVKCLYCLAVITQRKRSAAADVATSSINSTFCFNLDHGIVFVGSNVPRCEWRSDLGRIIR